MTKNTNIIDPAEDDRSGIVAVMTTNPNIIAPAEDVSAKVRTRRHALGVTQARLARLADCSVSSLALIEQGAVPRRSLVLERLNAALDAIEQVSAG